MNLKNLFKPTVTKIAITLTLLIILSFITYFFGSGLGAGFNYGFPKSFYYSGLSYKSGPLPIHVSEFYWQWLIIDIIVLYVVACLIAYKFLKKK